MMTEQSILPLTISYCELTQKLTQNKDSLPPEQVLACLISRDKIAHLINKQDQTTPEAALNIIQGDQQLRPLLPLISQLPQLKDWRVSLSPSGEVWWWPVPPIPRPSFAERFNWLWTALALVFLVISVTLILDISSRFLSGNTDVYGILAVIAPTVLALFTTRSVLTETGQEAARRILNSFKRIPKHWHEELGLIMSALLLVGLIIFWYNLPAIARQYNEWGLSYYQAGQLSTAQVSFERALKLDRNFLEAHYNLGVVYEDLLDFKEAQEQYQLALKDKKLDAAYNNLAHLYILEEKYNRAVPLLMTVIIENLIQDDEVRYDVKKNLGWARLGQKRYSEALPPLEEAIALYPDRAAAYCLRAQVYQGQQADQPKVEEAWSNCLQFADQTKPDEDHWVGLAQQYFQTLEEGSD